MTTTMDQRSSKPQDGICRKTCPGCREEVIVETNGNTPEWLLTMPVWCDRCADARTAGFEREQRELQQRQRFDIALRAGLVPPELLNASWGSLDPEIEALNHSAWSQGRAWVESAGKNLFISGDIGTGKTTLARACLHEAFMAGASVAETNGRRLCKTADSYREGEGIFVRWAKVKYLLLDDIDKARWTLDRVDALWELLDARATAKLRTIMTSNPALPGLVKVLQSNLARDGRENHSHVMAALDRMKPCVKLELTGKSLRAKE